MKLIVIRHGESEADIIDVIEGRADFSLTNKGKHQANLMAKYISSYKINKIYASPLKRAKETAEILSKEVKVKIEFLDDLMEFNNGLIAGLKKEIADVLYPKDDNLPFDQAMYEMESQKDFRLRAERVLDEIISNSNEQDIVVIISHGGLINRLYQSFLKMPIKTHINFSTGDTGIHIWCINNNKRTVLVTNDLSHLK